VTSPTVLVIDDNVNLARGFAIALSRHGYCVHVAHTADDGLRLARSVPVNAIVLDLRMPFINGLGYLYRLRELPELADTPVMVVTGAAVDEEMRKELSLLGATIRFKPIGVSDLLMAVGALLENPPASTRSPVGMRRPSTDK
jgi:DNA-binding response OmpR family regulator